MNRKLNTNQILRLVATLALVGMVWYFVSASQGESVSMSVPSRNRLRDVSSSPPGAAAAADKDAKMKSIEEQTIMPLMEDQTAKEELGRASWKYFHTLLARFPDKPTAQEREKLSTFVQLYAELYPCGECSYHFVKLLDKYPPQTSSRTAAALWGCHVHNIVNAYLKKPEYDCSTILDDYDCGCGGGDAAAAAAGAGSGSVTVEKEGRQHG